MEEQKKRGAPIGSQNRLGKTKDDGATSFLHIRCKPSDKAKWVHASQENGGIAAWVVKTLNENS